MRCKKSKKCDKIRSLKILNVRRELKKLHQFINAERDNTKWEEYREIAKKQVEELKNILDCIEVMIGKSLLSIVASGYGGCSATHVLRPPAWGEDLPPEMVIDQKSEKVVERFKKLEDEIKIPPIKNASEELRTIWSFIMAERDHPRWDEYHDLAIQAELEINHILDSLEIILGQVLLSVVVRGWGGCSATSIMRPPK